MIDSIRLGLSNVKSRIAEEAKELTKNIPTRNGIVIRVIRHNGHQFEATLLTMPTKCTLCNKMIWLPHAQRCELCKLVSHMKCVTKIGARCIKAQQTRENLPQHQLETPKIGLLTPTMCDHCGTFITVLQKYYECSSCSKFYHSDCRPFVANDCQPRSQDGRVPQYNNTSRLTIDQFDVLGLLGQGSFSKVYLARLGMDTKDNNLFAIKVIKKTNPVVNGDPASVLNEWHCLQLGRSFPFLTVAHCCFQSRERLFFVMEYVQGRDLLRYVEEQGAFPEGRVRFHSAEIVLALEYLHQNNIVYRDLKLNNVILDQAGHCKLIDFGMSKKLDERNQMRTNTFCGTVYYLSPEILRGDAYAYSVDWWSLGVMMYEMLCDCLPFNGKNDDKIFEAIKSQNVTYPNDVRLSGEARAILDGLLTKEVSRRLGCESSMGENSSEAIKRHPFFLHQTSGANSGSNWWQDIRDKKLEPPYVPATGIDFYPNHTKLTPMTPRQLDELDQSCFDKFSQYNESFAGTKNCQEMALQLIDL